DVIIIPEPTSLYVLSSTLFQREDLYLRLLSTILESRISWKGTKTWLKLLKFENPSKFYPSDYRPIKTFSDKLRSSIFRQSKEWIHEPTQSHVFYNDIPTIISFFLSRCIFPDWREAPSDPIDQSYKTPAFLREARRHSSAPLLVMIYIFVDAYNQLRWYSSPLTAVYMKIANLPQEEQCPISISYLPTTLSREIKQLFLRDLIAECMGRTHVAIVAGTTYEFDVSVLQLVADMPERHALGGAPSFQKACLHCMCPRESMMSLFSHLSYPPSTYITAFDGLWNDQTQHRIAVDVDHQFFYRILGKVLANIPLAAVFINEHVDRSPFYIPEKYKKQRLPSIATSNLSMIDNMLIFSKLLPLQSTLSGQFAKLWLRVRVFMAAVSSHRLLPSPLYQALYIRLQESWKENFPTAKTFSVHALGHMIHQMESFGCAYFFGTVDFEAQIKNDRRRCSQSPHYDDFKQGEWLCKHSQLDLIMRWKNNNLYHKKDTSKQFAKPRHLLFWTGTHLLISDTLLSRPPTHELRCYVLNFPRTPSREDWVALVHDSFITKTFSIHSTPSRNFSLCEIENFSPLYGAVVLHRSLVTVRIPPFTPGWQPDDLLIPYLQLFIRHAPVSFVPVTYGASLYSIEPLDLRWTVNQLRRRLTLYRLPVSGTKTVLQTRYQGFYSLMSCYTASPIGPD
ncbi:MAG: SAP domain-containing protein, partial [Candidatus Paceibacterota bacterium]